MLSKLEVEHKEELCCKIASSLVASLPSLQLACVHDNNEPITWRITTQPDVVATCAELTPALALFWRVFCEHLTQIKVVCIFFLLNFCRVLLLM